MPRRPRVVIVGSGFGGLKAARVLASSGAEVLLIDRNNYHTFIPLLYQVATAELEPEHIVYSVRSVLRRLPNASFIMAEVKRIDFVGQVVETDGPTIAYDYLILATGSQSQFLGVPGAPKYALPMRTLEEAVCLRNHILGCFERAVREPDMTQRERLLTFVIVGGGPTGVELAGALSELIHGSLAKDFPTLDLRQVRLVLVQSGDSLLADLPKRLGEYTQKRLRKMGVKVHLQAKVSQVTPEAVYLKDGTAIFTKTIVWTAGVGAALPDTTEELPTAAKGKVIVQPTLQVAEQPRVYAIGDVAYVEQDGQPLTGVAPEAIQLGAVAARNIERQLRGREPQPFSYFNKGRLAIIGRNAGVGQIGKLTFTGFPAWFIWLGVHLLYLPGFRNRLFVLITWICDYLFGDRFVRLILPSKTLLESEATLFADTNGTSPDGNRTWENQQRHR